MTDLTAEILHELFSYDVDTGIFIRIADLGIRARIGSQAGWVTRCGYCCMSIKYRKYLAHRLAWLYMTGKWPPHQIDHINGIRLDNRWVNLRLATNSQNQWNSKPVRASNTSGYKGVYWSKHANMWRATITCNGKQKVIGYRKIKEDAARLYEIAARQEFGEYARS